MDILVFYQNKGLPVFGSKLKNQNVHNHHIKVGFLEMPLIQNLTENFTIFFAFGQEIYAVGLVSITPFHPNRILHTSGFPPFVWR